MNGQANIKFTEDVIFITLANTTCKLPEDVVLTPKHVAVI